MKKCFFSLLVFLLGCFGDPEQDILKSARAEWKQYRFNNSIEKYKLLIEKFPDGKYVDQSLLRIGEIYRLNLDKEKEGLVYLYRLVNRGNVKYKYSAQKSISDIYKNDLRNYDQAIIEYQKLIYLFPYPQYADKSQYEIGRCYFKKGDYFQALTEFEILINEYPKSELIEDATYQRLNCFYILGDCGKAVEGFGKFVSDYPEGKYFSEAKYSIGNCLEEREDLAGALEIYKTIKGETINGKLLKIKIDGLEERLRKRNR